MKAIRIGICALVAFAVAAHGAVEPWSESVLEIGAAVLLVWWSILFASGRISLRGNWLLAPVGALWAFAGVQYLAHLSEVPFLTKIEILKFAALGILMFLAVQAYESLEHWHGFVWFLLGLGFLVSVLGILQHFTFNGKLYWFREMRYGGIPFGPYVNRNHFAGFVELVVPPGLATFFLRGEDRDRLSLLAVLTLLPIGALFLAASRGGILAFFVEVGVILILVFLLRRTGNYLAPAALAVLLACALVAWLGVGRALDRFTTYRQLEVSDSARAQILKDTLHIFRDHPLAGTGLGTLQEVFPRYETVYFGVVVNHAHNDYAEALAEMGLIGGICGIVFLGVLLGAAWARLKAAKNTMDLAYHIGALAACAGLLVHSFVDFNLHILSNALLFLLLAVLATSLTPLSGRGSDYRGFIDKQPQKSGVDIQVKPV